MSEAAPVTVTLDEAVRVKDITVAGHSIAAAVSNAELNARAAHRGDLTTLVVEMFVDEVVRENTADASTLAAALREIWNRTEDSDEAISPAWLRRVIVGSGAWRGHEDDGEPQ